MKANLSIAAKAVDLLQGIEPQVPPKALYRFSGERGLLALTDGTLPLAPAIHFNDPFEFFAGIDLDSLNESAVIQSVLSPKGLFKAAVNKESPEKLKNVAAYDAALIHAVKNTPEYWEEHCATMRDAIRGQAATTLGICCFSAFTDEELCGPLGIRHWSSYAENHRGIVVEYDGRHEFFERWAHEKVLFAVHYLKKRKLLSVSDFNDWSDALMWQTIRSWAECKCEEAWGHEREWRLMCPISNPDGKWITKVSDKLSLFRLWQVGASTEETAKAARAISRVILGAKIGPKLEGEIVAALKAPHFAHVILQRSRLSNYHYSLDYGAP